MLRPFIGDPDLPVAFFRSEAWGNAYVVVARLLVHAANRTGISPRLWTWLIATVLPFTLIFIAFYIYHVLRESR